MKQPLAHLIAALACCVCIQAEAGAAVGAPSAAERLHSLFDAEWQRGLRENPAWASRLGDHRYDDRWPDLGIRAIEQSHLEDRRDLETLLAISPDALDPEDRRNYRLFQLRLEQRIGEYAFRSSPGQALAYKAGQMKLSALRQRAEETLGGRFDVRAFHDEVLSRGSLPLDLLDEYFDAWLAAEVGTARDAGCATC